MGDLMKIKKVVLFTFIIICLFSIASVCAGEVNDDNMTATDTKDTLEICDENQVLKQTDDGEIIGDTDNGTFTALKNKIDAASPNSTVTLENNYNYNECFDVNGINISKPLTIDGKGFTIDANSKSRIFNVNTNDNVVFKNITFVGGNASYGGAINGKCTVINCLFKSNSADCGGAIYEGSAVNCTFEKNFANCGGAIYLNDEGSVEKCNFVNNTAYQYGGAIYLTKNNMLLADCNFINCNVNGFNESRGGAIYWKGNYGSLKNNNFTNCSVNAFNESQGGAIYWVGDNGSLKDCSFSNCSSESFVNSVWDTESHIKQGMAIYWMGKNGSLANCSFASCFSKGPGTIQGGAVYWRGNESKFEDCCFENNSADSEGFICLLDSESSLINCSFVNNDGGAVKNVYYVFNCSFINNSRNGPADEGIVCYFKKVIDSRFVNNKGRAIRGEKIDEIIYNCYFVNNYGFDGGAVYTVYSVDNCTFNNNQANRSGGAIYDAVNVANCKFINNSADLGGATHLVSNVINCSFINNSAISGFNINYDGCGGAILSSNYVFNCTFENNYAKVSGSAICIADRVEKCIFTNNHADNAYGNINYPAFCGDNIDDTVINCTFENNVGGGAYYVNAVNCIFKNNSPADYIWDFISCSKCTFIGEQVKTHFEIEVQNLDHGHKIFSVFLYDFKDRIIANVPIQVSFNGVTKKYSTSEYGSIGFTTDGLVPNTYTIKIAFNGNDNFMQTSQSFKVTINRINTKLIASKSSITTTYNVNKKLYVTLVDSDDSGLSGQKVTVSLNGIKKFTTNRYGEIVISTNNLAPKKYTVKITFAGNSKYAGSTKTVTITVKKATPKLIAAKKTFKKSVTTKKYTVKLKTNQNKPLNGVKVSVKVNGKTYSSKVKNGKATFKIKNLKKARKYKAVVTFKGNNYYNKVTKKVKIIVK